MKRKNIPEAGGFVYVIQSMGGVLYVVSINNLEKRIWEHKEKLVENSFTARNNVDKLVYFEKLAELYQERDREYQIKKWNRAKKSKLIQTKNQLFEDLAKDWFAE